MNFKGSATGETFNKDGKSAILLRHDGTNVFVAECSVWGGKERAKNKIRQLTERYLTWRESKTAIIFFVNQKKVSHVYPQIVEAAEEHPYIINQIGDYDGPGIRFKAHLEGDEDQEFDLTFLAFHIPPKTN
jgi:hypothetical protein